MILSGLSSIIPRTFLHSFAYNIVVFVYFLSFFPTTIIASSTSRLGGNYTDQLALLALKAQISDPLRVLNSWNETIHFCQWLGVTCGHRHQRVTRLILNDYRLGGSLSPHIGNLSFLRILDLRNNKFSQEIPQEFGRLKRLQILVLPNNSISGEIPANLSGCSKLTRLDFSSNSLVGKIPPELGSLSKIQNMIIFNNSVTGGIPIAFANLTSLEELNACRNNLGGNIPDSFGELRSLTGIIFGINRLSGTIPPSIYNISSLKVIDIAQNDNIIGSLPSDIGNTLPKLRYLGINGNQFTGTVPISICNATNLEVLSISSNNLTGKFPPIGRLHKLHVLDFAINHLKSGGSDDSSLFSSLTNATNLRGFSMDGNNFGGMLHKCFSNLSTKLEMFAIADNDIFGSFPSGIENLIELRWLNMWGNKLTGEIPTEIGRLGKLGILNLFDNSFFGYIPHTLGNLSSLTKLGLQKNYFQGGVPVSLVECYYLTLLDLSDNNLSGTIPPEIFSLPSLSISLDLSRNHFSGSLPREVGNLQNLGALVVSDNMLSGEIPSTIGSCVRLELLDMGNNLFHGIIPSSLRFLRGLRQINLSHNNLSGNIPEYFEGFNSLQELNLSYNDFEGVVPMKGAFLNTNITSVVGNSKLCGGTPKLQLPRCNYGGHKKSGLTHILKSVIPAVSGLLGLIFLSCFLYFWSCSKKKRATPSSGYSESFFLKVSYQSLSKATDGFSESKLVGAGSFGSVYEGILDQDGKKIAVKVLNLFNRSASKSFLAECKALRNIRHRNLVKVVSVCSGVDYQNNDFKALVYEFMDNGNLDEWLHRKNLSSIWRLNIAIDVASALDYLHHRCHTRIVHCDLKPSNVLLDNDMTAHVGDFGLARILLDADCNTKANQTSSIGFRGSVGYAAPEYGMGNPVSIAGDVYSYGILLLEMFTGKRPTDEMFSDGLNLNKYAMTALPDRVAAIADPIFLQSGEDGESSEQTNMTRDQITWTKISEYMVSIFEIGIACSAESPSERLDIADVIAKLCVIKDNLCGAEGIYGGRRSTVAGMQLNDV